MLLKAKAFRIAAVVAGFLISAETACAGANQIAVIGPVDQINCSAGTYRVLGVSFKAGSKSITSELCESLRVNGTPYVVAAGLQSESGKILGTELSEIRSGLYVAGASVVFLRGVVSRVNAATGEFEVAGSRVIAMSGQTPALGSQVDVIGTQPQPGTVVIADLAYPSADAKTYSDPRIANAIIGSGSSKRAIIGSGSASEAIIGSGASAIIGSGATSMAIIGSGASDRAIIGSGFATKAIIGSGSAKSAIIGSGASTKAIIGSGAL